MNDQDVQNIFRIAGINSPDLSSSTDPDIQNIFKIASFNKDTVSKTKKSGTDPVALIKKYFPQSEWERATNVMMGESGGNPAAVGDDRVINGLYAPSYGLFQIRGLAGRPDPSLLKDPEFNVRYAAKMQAEQGWGPWTVARNLGYVNKPSSGLPANPANNFNFGKAGN